MPTVNLSWDYDMSGPLPTTVEVIRDDVVIYTASSPIVSYSDDVSSSLSEATYKIRAINGAYQEESEPFTVYFEDFGDYDHFFILSSNLIDSVDPSVELSNANPSFTSDGLDIVGTTGSVSRYFQYDNNPEFGLNYTPFTIECVVKGGVQTQYCSLIEAYATPTEYWALRVDYTNGSVYFIYNENEYASTTNIMDNTQHKVAVVHDGTQIKIFIDDVLDSSFSSTLPSGMTYGTFYVGFRATNASKFEGYIRSLGISSQALYG